MWGAHVAVNRIAPPQESDGISDAFLPEQRIDLATALTAYTRGSAFVNHLDDVTGTISVGNLADLALLDRDPFQGPDEKISSTRVVGTWVEGEQVFAAS
jgi:predicted amidohydrolase YtcJ